MDYFNLAFVYVKEINKESLASFASFDETAHIIIIVLKIDYLFQPKYDVEPMADVLHEYKGMLSAWPDVLNIQKVCKKYIYCYFF